MIECDQCKEKRYKGEFGGENVIEVFFPSSDFISSYGINDAKHFCSVNCLIAFCKVLLIIEEDKQVKL